MNLLPSKHSLDKQKVQQLEPIINKHCCDAEKVIEQIYGYYEEVEESICDFNLDFPGFKFGQKAFGALIQSPVTRSCALVVVQQPPMVRLIKFLDKSHKITTNPYSLPYMVFTFLFSDMQIEGAQCYFKKEPLTSPFDTVYRCPLPNVNMNGLICLGIRSPNGSSYIESLDYFFEEFWSSVFTNDHMSSFEELAVAYPEHFASMETWSQWSQTNPEYAFQAPYKQLGPLNKVPSALINKFQGEKARHILRKTKEVVVSNFNTNISNDRPTRRVGLLYKVHDTLISYE